MTVKTIYPSYGDYNLSVANLGRFAREPRLLQARPQQMPNGNLVAYSGGYSRVYPVHSSSGTYALRCWTADVGDAQERYRQIGRYLTRQGLPYFVEFEYLERALVVKGQHFPVLWMQWADGPRLREFVGQNVGNKPVLRALAYRFREMVAALHAAQISHGDLQDENIIVQDGPGGPRLRLIDYDSVYVPALQGYSDQIIGVSHYQHPRRNTLRTASERVDYFSELVIYLSLLAYEQNPSLWRPQAEKQLLFTDTDFVAPNRSKAFNDLRFMTGEVRTLTDRLIQYCHERDLLRLEPLEAVTAGTAAPAGSTPGTPRPIGSLPSGFLDAPAAASTFAAGRRRPPLADDFVSSSGAPRPGLAPAPAPAVDVPEDFLSVRAAAPQPATAPAPAGLPDDFLRPTPKAALQGAARAAAEGVRAGSWDAFFEGASRTATSRPGAAVLAAAPAVRAAPAVPPPAPSKTASAPAVQIASPRRGAVSPANAVGSVDWATVFKGFVVGLVIILLVLLFLTIRAGVAAPDTAFLGAGAEPVAARAGAGPP